MGQLFLQHLQVSDRIREAALLSRCDLELEWHGSPESASGSPIRSDVFEEPPSSIVLTQPTTASTATNFRQRSSTTTNAHQRRNLERWRYRYGSRIQRDIARVLRHIEAEKGRPLRDDPQESCSPSTKRHHSIRPRTNLISDINIFPSRQETQARKHAIEKTAKEGT